MQLAGPGQSTSVHVKGHISAHLQGKGETFQAGSTSRKTAKARQNNVFLFLPAT